MPRRRRTRKLGVVAEAPLVRGCGLVAQEGQVRDGFAASASITAKSTAILPRVVSSAVWPQAAQRVG